LLTSNWTGDVKAVLKPDSLPSQPVKPISPDACHRLRSHQRWPSPASSTNRSSMIHCMMIPELVSSVGWLAGIVPSPYPDCAAQFLGRVRTSLIWLIAAAAFPVFRAASAARSFRSAYLSTRSLLADPPWGGVSALTPSGLLYFWKMRPSKPSSGFEKTLRRGSLPKPFFNLSVIRNFVDEPSLKSPLPPFSII